MEVLNYNTQKYFLHEMCSSGMLHSRVVILYCRFRTTYWPHLHGSRSPAFSIFSSVTQIFYKRVVNVGIRFYNKVPNHIQELEKNCLKEGPCDSNDHGFQK
jgi:hypothetical protein